ncbi:MFS transporter [Parvibium lacunae]|uniref:MFS transporter n=1 Tax=Parvibium lacunae TaxID=1888893 RepID=A0A368L7U1_9BURK|nr:MFS transporter [Parvibium lacunae]RCS59677.1 MFS transporter [Parvibium lacunae]
MTRKNALGLILPVVIGCYMLSFFHRFAPAALAQTLAVSLNSSATALGILASSYFYVYTVMQIPTGVLVDALGSRVVLTAGGIVASIGSLIFALAISLEYAVIGRTLIGLGVSVTFIAMLKILAQSYPAGRFSSMVGLCMLLGNLGSVFAGTPLAWLTQQIGWRLVFAGLALLSLLLAGLCWRLLKQPPIILPANTARTGSNQPQQAVRKTMIRALANVIQNRETWPAVLINLGISGSFFAFGGLWAGPWLQQVHGLTAGDSSQLLSLYFGGFAIGTWLIGTLSDRYQRRKPFLIVGSHLYACCWLAIWNDWLPSVSYFYLCAPLFGLLTATFVLTWPCAKEVNDPAYSGISTAVTNMGGFTGGALLLPLIGCLMDRAWDGSVIGGVRQYQPEHYATGFTCLLCFALLAAVISWRIRETHCQQQH